MTADLRAIVELSHISADRWSCVPLTIENNIIISYQFLAPKYFKIIWLRIC